MKILTVLITVLTMSGCSLVGSGVEKAAQANDEALKAAEFTICQGASIGSIRRKFDTPEKAEMWKSLCKENQDFQL